MGDVPLMPLTIGALGLCVTAVYCVRCHRADKEPKFGVIVALMSQTSAAVCGLLLALGVYFDGAKELLQQINLFVFIAGLVTFAAFVEKIYRGAIKDTRKE